ncbi:MAG TPA: hypothetical protein VL096_15270, partial [Pirellulaceae bacterium]|nr:hypothetical protein [Pirellulaceae bacterium]
MSNVPPSPAPSSGPPPKQWSNRLAIFAALAMVLGPISYMAIPREIATWHAAAAQEADWSDNDAEAFAQLDKALAWDPQNAQWWLQRAKLHQARERYDEALADCDQALVVEPDHPLAVEQRNEVLVLLKRYDEVLADWRKRLHDYETEGSGQPRQIYNGLAYFLAVANREPEEALQLVQKVLEKDPRDPGVLDTRGFIYYRLGKLGEARSDLDQAIHLMEIQMPY